MKADQPQNVKYFIGALFTDEALLEKAREAIIAQLGAIDLTSESFPFTTTNYYESEMGRPICRHFWGIEILMSPGKLAELKILCNAIEDKLAVDGKRKVNLDIGYLDFHKLVLASAKYNGQKIYLDLGIYADLTLNFQDGDFHALENTFPDFKSGSYNEVFLDLRNLYKRQLKASNSSNIA